MPKSPILGGFSTQRSRNAADNAAYNLQIEVVETKDGKVPGFLFGSSGLDLVGTLGSGPIRGELELMGTMYVVSGPEVYSLTANGIATLRGEIIDQDTPVDMVSNGRQLLIVDGVGAWIVPGGYPLTAGDIGPVTSADPAGGLYAVNDTITLLADSGFQSSYPIVTVTAIANNPVSNYSLVNAGTSYTNASNIATAPIQPQPGIGTGLLVNITSVSAGVITGLAVNDGGGGYAVNDTGTISGGAGVAVYQVTGVSGGGVVTGLRLLNPGSAYATGSAIATKAVPGIPTNTGTGLTLTITGTAGPITSSVMVNRGQGYAVGAVGYIPSGSGDATFLITAIGAIGAVTGFTITQGGAINAPATSFSQRSTSGSGSGFVLSSPSYGAFIGLVPVTVPFPNPVSVDISDGFGLMTFLDQQYLAASDELDLSTWPALSYGVADQSPDTIIAVRVVHDEAYVLKHTETEVWVDQGLANFAFGPLTGVHMEVGCMAQFSIAVADEELIWLSRNDQGQGVFVMARAYQVEPIGTQALTAELEKYPNLGDCIAYVRQEGGHVYYVATFPEANVTWCFDKTASKLAGAPIWTRLAAWNNGEWGRHWGNCFASWPGGVAGTPPSPGQGILGDYRNGNLYAFNPATYTDNGTLRRWLRRWRALPRGQFGAVKFSWLAIDMETGAGAPPGTKPRLVLRWSDDGGHTWSNERIVPVGALGETAFTVKFNRLGMTRRFSGSDRIFELSSSDPFKVAVLDAEVEAI